MRKERRGREGLELRQKRLYRWQSRDPAHVEHEAAMLNCVMKLNCQSSLQESVPFPFPASTGDETQD